MNELIRTILKEYVEKNNITLEEIFLPKGFFDCILKFMLPDNSVDFYFKWFAY